MKGFALGLALKQRRKATRKSPITNEGEELEQQQQQQQQEDEEEKNKRISSQKPLTWEHVVVSALPTDQLCVNHVQD